MALALGSNIEMIFSHLNILGAHEKITKKISIFSCVARTFLGFGIKLQMEESPVWRLLPINSHGKTQEANGRISLAIQGVC